MVVWIELNLLNLFYALMDIFVWMNIYYDLLLSIKCMEPSKHQNSVNRINVFLKCCTFFNIANKEVFYVQVNNYTIKAN